MSSYRSAYENYYKNINSNDKRKRDHLILGRKTDDRHKPIYNIKDKNTMMNFFIKRIITELTGATILLLFFLSIKYIPSSKSDQIYSKCKQVLNYNFNYDECIDAFNQIEIGNIKGEDLKVGDFSTEDLKIENLKVRAANFIEYIKNNKSEQVTIEN